MQLRIGGVPEHFNLPWHRLLDSGKLDTHGIEATWQDFPEGTGAMINSLNEGTVDMAMLLTDGAVAGIDKGGAFKIVSFYTVTPLLWGVHVPDRSSVRDMKDTKGRCYAVSRYGSGSHLMAFVHAKNHAWPLDNLHFEVINNLDGARAALKEGSAEVFLWEKFTTQPFVDNGEFRRVGICPTPWPCFVICVREEVLEQSKVQIAQAITEVQQQAALLVTHPHRIAIIAEKYQLQPEDVEEWLGLTAWANSTFVDKAVLEEVNNTLKELGLVSQECSTDNLVYAL